MQGLSTTQSTKNRIRSGLAALAMGAAASSLLAAPVNAQGAVNWSGPYVSIGVGATIMDTDTKVDASRDGQIDVAVDGLIEFDATLFPLAQRQQLAMDGLTDAGVSGHLSVGWDQRLDNFLIGAFFDYNFYNISADFSSKVWAEGGAPSIDFECEEDCEEFFDGLNGDSELVAGIIGGVIGASLAHAIRDEHIEIDGKIEQDYAIAAGGRFGYIWGGTFMTYLGAAWTRTSIDGHVNINIADPVCGSEFLCSEIGNPTSIRLNLDDDVDGYKLLIGGEYALGNAMGGSWFLRGQAEYADYDGISAAFSGQKNQDLIDFDVIVVGVDIDRQINEAASASISKEDYSVYGSLVYKLNVGG